jgi:Retrotransposon gag protein
MKSGRAAKWAAHIFKWEEENVGYTKFLDWDTFKLEFRKEFCPANSNAAAINKLESIAYYQRSWSVDDYLHEFLDLIAESGYMDPKTLVVKFRRGLDPRIQDSVATMANGCPSDTTPTAWYEAA